MSTLNFTKEEVQPVIVTSSLLSSTLASPRNDTVNSRNTTSSSSFTTETTTRMTIPSTVSATHPLSSSFGSGSTGHYRTLFTVSQVVSSVMTKYLNDNGILNNPVSPNNFGRNPSYALMIADDDGNIDQDFPEVDGNVSITSIGVDKFIICDNQMKPLIALTIPETSMTIKAADTHRQPQHYQELLLTCTPFTANPNLDDPQQSMMNDTSSSSVSSFTITLVSD